MVNDLELKPMSILGGYALIYKSADDAYWRKLEDAEGKTKFFASSTVAMSAGRREFGIPNKPELLSACPAPAPELTQDQRDFYDRKAEEMAITNHLVKRRPVVEVVNRNGRTLRMIGDLK